MYASQIGRLPILCHSNKQHQITSLLYSIIDQLFIELIFYFAGITIICSHLLRNHTALFYSLIAQPCSDPAGLVFQSCNKLSILLNPSDRSTIKESLELRSCESFECIDRVRSVVGWGTGLPSSVCIICASLRT